MLPPPRSPGHYRIALVCLGNICRSPMAQVILEHRLAEAGLSDVVAVTSSGTGGWHEGKGMHERPAAALTAAGLDPTRHRARTFATSWHVDHDLVLAMDHDNLRDVGGRTDRTRLFRDFDPVDPGHDVPDPYYGGPAGFEEVLRMVERTSVSLVAALRRERGQELALP